jgi:hypothetical protein
VAGGNVEKQVPQATAQVIENLHPLREAGPEYPPMHKGASTIDRRGPAQEPLPSNLLKIRKAWRRGRPPNYRPAMFSIFRRRFQLTWF